MTLDGKQSSPAGGRGLSSYAKCAVVDVNLNISLRLRKCPSVYQGMSPFECCEDVDVNFSFSLRLRLRASVHRGACIALVCSTPLHAMASSDSTMMMPSLNKIHECNMKLILDKLYKNLEKQLLVLAYLEEMNADGGVDQESVVHEFEIADEPLAPLAYKYSGWKKSLVLELFAYVEPTIWHMAWHEVV